MLPSKARAVQKVSRASFGPNWAVSGLRVSKTNAVTLPTWQTACGSGTLGLSAEVPELAAARSPPRRGELEFDGLSHIHSW